MSELEKKTDAAVKGLGSTNFSEVIKGLNYITTKSFELDMSFNLETFPQVTLALAELLNVINPLGCMLTSPPDEPVAENASKHVLGSEHECKWTRPMPLLSCQKFKMLATTIDENNMLLSILNILRNLSMDIPNETQIAESTIIMRHLVALILASGTKADGTFYECSQLAYEVLFFIIGKIDLNGKRRKESENSAWLEDTLTMDARSREHLKMRLLEDDNQGVNKEYLFITDTVLSYAHYALKRTNNRVQVHKCLELLSKLASVPENAPALALCPKSTLQAVVSLMSASTAATDPFQFIPPSDTMIATEGNQPLLALQPLRIPASTCNLFADFVDSETRDLALEVVYAMCANCAELCIALAATPYCMKILLRIMKAAKSFTGQQLRADTSAQRAAATLTQMAQNPANTVHFVSIQHELCLDALTDDTLAGMIQNPVFLLLHAYVTIFSK